MSAAGPVASATPDIDGDCLDAIRDAWEACREDGDGSCGAAIFLLVLHCGPAAMCILGCIIEGGDDLADILQCVVWDCLMDWG